MQLLFQTVLLCHTHGHPLTMQKLPWALVHCSAFMKNWEMGLYLGFVLFWRSVGSWSSHSLSWQTVTQLNCVGILRGWMTWAGVPWGETLTKLVFPQTSMNQHCWRTYLKLWFCSRLPLCFGRVSGEPGRSPIKAIAATEAESLFRLRKMAACPFTVFASLLN